MSFDEDEDVVGGFQMADDGDDEPLDIPEGEMPDLETEDDDPEDRYH